MRRIALSLCLFVFCSTFPFLVCSAALAAVECPAPGSVVELFGTIGKNPSVSMNLTFQKDRLSGTYAYVKHREKIFLSGTCTGGSLTLQESTASGKPTGSFRGSFIKPQIVEGTWSTPDGKKNLPFRLQALLPTDHVSGRYERGNYLDKNTSTGGGLDILLLEPGRVRIQGDAVWVNPANPDSVHTGEVIGRPTLKGTKPITWNLATTRIAAASRSVSQIGRSP